MPTLAFGEAVALPMDGYGGEPNLIVHADGETLFVTAPAGYAGEPNLAEGAAWLWRSDDGGATWETLRAPGDAVDRGFCSCDADVVSSPDGWVYYTDWWIASASGVASAGNFLVERSPDGGDSWESMPVTMPDTKGVDRQWLVAGEDGFVGLFYSYFENRGVRAGPSNVGLYQADGRRIDAVFSQDHGRTWGAPVTVVEDARGVFPWIAHPYVLPDGTLFLPYGVTHVQRTFWQDPSEVRAALSRDGGETWTSVRVARAPGGFDNVWPVQGAVDEAGNLFVAWSAREGRNVTLHLSESRDGGASWSEPARVATGGLHLMPWVAATGEGRVAVVWYGANATGRPTEVPEDTPWYAFAAERPAWNATWAVGRASAEPVKVGPLCPWGGACEEDRELLDYASLDYAADGTLHVAFARSVPGESGEDASARVFVTRAVPSSDQAGAASARP